MKIKNIAFVLMFLSIGNLFCVPKCVVTMERNDEEEVVVTYEQQEESVDNKISKARLLGHAAWSIIRVADSADRVLCGLSYFNIFSYKPPFKIINDTRRKRFFANFLIDLAIKPLVFTQTAPKNKKTKAKVDNGLVKEAAELWDAIKYGNRVVNVLHAVNKNFRKMIRENSKLGSLFVALNTIIGAEGIVKRGIYLNKIKKELQK